MSHTLLDRDAPLPFAIPIASRLDAGIALGLKTRKSLLRLQGG